MSAGSYRNSEGKTLYEEAAKKRGPSAQTGDQQKPAEEGEVHRKSGGDDVIDAEFEAKDK